MIFRFSGTITTLKWERFPAQNPAITMKWNTISIFFSTTAFKQRRWGCHHGGWSGDATSRSITLSRRISRSKPSAGSFSCGSWSDGKDGNRNRNDQFQTNTIKRLIDQVDDRCCSGSHKMDMHFMQGHNRNWAYSASLKIRTQSKSIQCQGPRNVP